MLRTFRQYGKGYFSNQVTVVAKIDGQEIYSGPVPTEDIVPPLKYPYHGKLVRPDVLFEWQDVLNTNLVTKFLEISVTDGILLLSDTHTNFITPIDPFDYFHCGYRFYENGQEIWDPLSGESIDLIPQTKHRAENKKGGQSPWVIPSGSTFSANLTSDRIYFLSQRKPVRLT